MSSTDDFRRYADLESYLFKEVGPVFVRSGNLSPEDLFTIFIWKANRKKFELWQTVADQGGGTDFAAGTATLVGKLKAAKGPCERLKAVMEFGFRLPTATAILTVLYPEDFTVYDFRVCDSLRDFHGLGRIGFSVARWPEIWAGYEKFKSAVIRQAPPNLTLRQCDHHHWGRSFDKDRKRDAANGRPPNAALANRQARERRRASKLAR